MEEKVPGSVGGSSDTGLEKSPIEPSDYAGLQLDTEAEARNRRGGDDERPSSIAKSPVFSESDRSPGAIEKGLEVSRSDEGSPPAPSYEAPIPKIDGTMKETVARRADGTAKGRRMCGMNPRTLILLLALVLVIVIVASVVGGVVGSRNAASSAASPPAPSTATSSGPIVTPTADPAAVNAGLPKSDVTVASPLVPVAFTQNASGSHDLVQTYWLFFQTVNSNIKQCVQGAGAVNTDWQSATPIFTDAHNNSGLAAITYINQSQPQTSLFYTGADSTLWEKRLYVGTSIWELGSLTNSHFAVSGNSSFQGDGGWNGFRMAAAYSANFSTGPGARLFYHGGNATKTWIQELIWYQANDTWATGAVLFGADPNSHLAVTIEPHSHILRLFYSSGGGTVEEQWINITASGANYSHGVVLQSILAKVASEVAAISTNDSTFLYYSSAPSPTANITIHELALSPQPGSAASASSSLVAIPDLLANDTDRTVPSAFAPLSAVLSTLNGGQQITVLFAESVVDPKAGYGALKSVSRLINETWGPASYGQSERMTQIPLGDDNANPS